MGGYIWEDKNLKSSREKENRGEWQREINDRERETEWGKSYYRWQANFVGDTFGMMIKVMTLGIYAEKWVSVCKINRLIRVEIKKIIYFVFVIY